MKNTGMLRIVSNLCLLLIIGLVALSSFGTHALAAREPALKGRTGADNVALQIAVDQSSDVEAYMEALERAGAHGTFFFCSQCYVDNALLQQVKQRGHGVGYYTCAAHEGQETGMYIGGGYSVTVMSYDDGENMQQVCPSINLTKLKKLDDWTEVLSRRISGDMFLYIAADNDQEDFKKVVQIVLDKGYTILKVDEML